MLAVFVDGKGNKAAYGIGEARRIDDVEVFGGADAELSVAVDIREVGDDGIDIVGLDGVDVVGEVFVV